MKKNNKKKLGLSLNSGVYPIRIPLLHSKDEIVTNYGLFSGITAGLSEMSCFAQTASFGFSPHTSHQHKGEEIIIVLSGNTIFLTSSTILLKLCSFSLRNKFITKLFLQKLDFTIFG